MRASWDETWMAVAHVIGRRSKCSRRGIGAVLVSVNQRLVSTGYNGPPAGLEAVGPCIDWCPRAQNPDLAGVGYDNCLTAHSEMNAIAWADRSSMEGGTLYVSSAVCFGCAKVVANSGVVRVVHCVTDADAHRQPELAERLLRSSGLDVVRWKDAE